jgi:HEAT repeat protein
MKSLALAIVFSLVAMPVLAATAAARKKPAGPQKAKMLGADALEKLRDNLQGDDASLGAAAAKQLGESGAANAGEVLVAVLAVGTVPERGEAALDALAKLADPATIDILELYAGHRSPDLRRRAVAALGAMSDGRVVPTLLARLGDAAPDVRAAAAEALAARKEKKANGRLFKLVKKNDAAAAGPLGMLATPDLVPQIAELQGGVNDEVLATTLGEYIKRSDVPDKLRVEVIKTMGKLSGVSTTAALIEYLASVPAKEDRASQREAQKLVDDRSKQK